MHHAEDVMKKKFEVCTVETVTQDVRFLIKNYGYEDLLVVDNMRERHFVGVVHAESVSDEALKNADHPFEMRAKNFMDGPPSVIGREASIQECLRMMNANHLRTLPVIDESGQCIGVIRKNDLLYFYDSN